MKKLIVAVITVFSFVTFLHAEIPERPNPPKLVNDFANVLSKNEAGQLEGALEQFARETSTQIVVVTIPDLEGYDKADYAQRLGEKWGVGQNGKDNGLVILLKPKTSESAGEVFVAPGYGLEGVLPDAVVNSTVIENEMMPYFKQDDYFSGLTSGIKVIMEITRGEYTAKQYQQSVGGGGGSFIPFIIIMFVLIFGVFGRGRRRRFYSPGRSLPFWLAMGMMSGGARRSSGSFGNFTSGGGSFGGGGFGGFGGGGFGGGGAGGSW
ncbi:TPM domain-containing protein [Draconibacterium sp.]|nr:TPM domain-containing protein [Draconibacterium sp.]